MLDELSARGYELLSVEAMPATEDRKAVYLRHDVDLHIPGIERIAAVESDLGVSATYFVPLSLHFNPAYPEKPRHPPRARGSRTQHRAALRPEYLSSR